MSAVRFVTRLVLSVMTLGALTLFAAPSAGAATLSAPAVTAATAQVDTVTRVAHGDIDIKRDWLITLRDDDLDAYELTRDEVTVARYAEGLGLEVADWHFNPGQIVLRGSARTISFLRYDSHVKSIAVHGI